MKSSIVIVDSTTGGLMPVESSISVDHDSDMLKFKCDKVGLEIWIRLLDIGMVLGDEFHG